MTKVSPIAKRFAKYDEFLTQEIVEPKGGLDRREMLPFSSMDVPVERYISRRFHELEKERLWSRVWQMACREEHIPVVGDQHVYEIADKQYLIVRSAEGAIRAFANSCPHRGRQLRDYNGRAENIRCAFHGLTWTLDGTLSFHPCANEFPERDKTGWALTQVKVGLWGGFVFINPDPDAEPLEDYLGEIQSHFRRWPLERRFVALHIQKLMRCNWKIAQEAFMEALHVSVTHPQHSVYLGDRQTQYDVFGNSSRGISPLGTPSPIVKWDPSEQDIIDAMTDRTLDEPIHTAVPEGWTARRLRAERRREALRPAIGEAADALLEAELSDAFFYTIFPNFHPWGSYNEIVYRFRPNLDDHRTSMMEVMLVAPFSGDRPPPAPVRYLGLDEGWSEVEEFGALARVFEQDSYNLPRVQTGLEASLKGFVSLAAYQETKLRHFHELHQKWVGD